MPLLQYINTHLDPSKSLAGQSIFTQESAGVIRPLQQKYVRAADDSHIEMYGFPVRHPPTVLQNSLCRSHEHLERLVLKLESAMASFQEGATYSHDKFVKTITNGSFVD